MGISFMIHHFASRGQHHQELLCSLIAWVGSQLGISLLPPSLFSPCPAFGTHTEKGYFQSDSVVPATDGQEGGPENSSSIGCRPARSVEAVWRNCYSFTACIWYCSAPAGGGCLGGPCQLPTPQTLLTCLLRVCLSLNASSQKESESISCH